MSHRFRKQRRVSWDPDLDTYLADDRDRDVPVLLAFLSNRSRDTFMQFKNRMRRYKRAESPLLQRILDSGELAGGVLYYALDEAGTLPLDFLLGEGWGDSEERARWATQTAEALAALHAAELPHARLKPSCCRIDETGTLRLGDPDFLTTKTSADSDDAALTALQALLSTDSGRSLAPAFSEALAAYRALPEPKPVRARPKHKRPAPDLERPGETTGPGPYKVPNWAKGAVITIVALIGSALARWLAGGG